MGLVQVPGVLDQLREADHAVNQLLQKHKLVKVCREDTIPSPPPFSSATPCCLTHFTKYNNTLLP